nr:cellulose binding domain-containing protein [Actinomycetes bacterium]
AGVEGDSGTSDLGFTVSLSDASVDAVSVGYSTADGTAVAGGDYVAGSGTVTFAPGVTSQLVTVGVLGDGVVEANETLTVTLSGPLGATIADGTAIGTITNDDTATDPIPDPDPDPTNPGIASVSFVKSSDWGSGFNGDVTVTNTGTQALPDWQVEFDFDGDISSIWNAAIVSKTGNRYLVQGANWNSDVAAGSSTAFGFTATAGTPSNFALAGTAIPDDPDPAPEPGTPLLSVSNTSIDEGNSGTSHLVFNLSMSAPADDIVTVNYRTEDFTAAAGTDYQATEGTLTFATGETSKQVHVSVLGDTVFEGNESMLLVLSDIDGAQFDGSNGVGLIRNDDANPNGTADPEYRVVGYFTEWGIYQRGFDVADIPADLLTDINYAFADINDNGEVVLFDSFAAVEKTYPGDTWDQPIRGNFNQLAKLKEEHPDVNVLISIGGWTLSEDFSDVAATQQSREKFAESAVDFITTYGFDGIDLDWEYPVEGGEADNVHRPEDDANYVLLVQEIRRQLELLESTDGIDGKEYLLTIASPAGYDKIENYDLAGMAPYLDWFQVMAYDYYGAGWSNQTGNFAGLYPNPDAEDPLYNTDHAVSLYLEQVDPSKIVLGAPLYGHSWKGVPDGGDGGLNDVGTGAGVASYGDLYGNISYWQIVELLEDHPDLYQVYWDDQAKASYIYGAADGTFISYESPEALQYRLDYIKDLGLGGIMFWEIDDDIRDYDDPRSLLALAARELLGGQGQTD